MREWEEKADDYARLANLGRHEQKLVESSNLEPRLAIALVNAIKDKGAREAALEAAHFEQEAAALDAESDAHRLEHAAEHHAQTARVNQALFETWQAEQKAEKARRETWTPPPPIGQLRP